jgi:hypothetical protein
VSVLLRQAGGSEGLVVVPAVAHLDDLSGANAKDAGITELALDAAVIAPHRPAVPHDHAVPALLGVRAFEMVLAEVLTHAPVLPDHLVDPRKRTLLGQALDNVKHDIRVEQLPESLYVPGVPQLRGATHDLHVLLRHRPQSMSQGLVQRVPRKLASALA